MTEILSAPEGAIHRLLNTSFIRRVRSGMGGSHTVVTYPPLDSLPRLSGVEPFELRPPQGVVNYYVHIAFCEWICTFCHYAKMLHTPDRPSALIGDYLDAIEIEMQRRGEALQGAEVGTVYIGGGTPTALETRRLSRLLTAIKTYLGKALEICIEASPLTIAASAGMEKISIMRAADVGRISLGIQTFDEKILPMLRGHGIKAVMLAADRVCASGVSVNFDLIQDLPGQTRESIENDLKWIAKYKPQQVTWYMLRFHPDSSMWKVFERAGTVGQPDDLESALRRELIIRVLEGIGYRSQPGCRFTLDGAPDQYKSVRGGVDSQLLGIGVSAYSHGWGYFFRNIAHTSTKAAINEYVQRMRGGRSAVEWCTPLDRGEVRAGQVCEGVRGRLGATLVSGAGVQPVTARAMIDRLVEWGLMQRVKDGWSLTSLGKLFEEEVVSLFYSPAVRERLWTANAYWAERDWFVSPAGGGVEEGGDDRDGAVHAAIQRSTKVRW